MHHLLRFPAVIRRLLTCRSCAGLEPVPSGLFLRETVEAATRFLALESAQPVTRYVVSPAEVRRVAAPRGCFLPSIHPSLPINIQRSRVERSRPKKRGCAEAKDRPTGCPLLTG